MSATPVGGGGNNSKGSKVPPNSSAAASFGVGGLEVPVTPAPVGGGSGKKSNGPKGPESSSAAASSGGGGAKGPAKAAVVEDLTLTPRVIAQNIHCFTFVNTSGQILEPSKICGHMMQPPGFSCTKADCSAKLVKGGYCYTTATGILFAVVQPKTGDNNRAYWRAPTAEEITSFKMPVAATAAGDS